MAEKALEIQQMVRMQAEETEAFTRDLNNWKKNIKLKDDHLKQTTNFKNKVLPPVRNSASSTPKKSEPAKPKDEEKRSASLNSSSTREPTPTKPKKIGAYSYRDWDLYNVDAEIDKLQKQEEIEATTKEQRTETPGDDEDEARLNEATSEIFEDMEREKRFREHLANQEKEKGNLYFKEGKYVAAIDSYTKSMEYDPFNAILPANRAMANLNMKKFKEAEEDCSIALKLDRKYIKAWLRRATARDGLGNFEGAKTDLNEALALEPHNKQALQHLKTVSEKIVQAKKSQASSHPPPASSLLPLKKDRPPFKRIPIEEIGTEDEEEEKEEGKEEEKKKPKARTINSVPEQSREVRENHGQQTRAAAPQGLPIDMSQKGEKLPSTSRPNHPVPPVGAPKTAMDFFASWKAQTEEGRFDLLKLVEPSALPKLIGVNLESLLAPICLILATRFVPASLPVSSYLQHLAKTPRFSTILMFLDSTELAVVKGLFVHLASAKEGSSDYLAPDALSLLKKAYQQA